MRYFNKKRFTMRQVVGLLTFVFLGITVIAYAAVTVPNSFSNGQTISSGQVNQNFTALGNAMPAVKTATAGSTVLTTSYSDIIALSITPVTNGYVYVQANGYACLYNVTTTKWLYIGISETSAVAPSSSNRTAYQIDGIIGGGDHCAPYSANAVFPVTGGVLKDIYLVGNESAADGILMDNRLTALFIPSLQP